MSSVTSLPWLTDERRAMLGQLIRYGVTGGFTTLLYAIVYTAVAAVRLPTPPNLHLQVANLCGYIVAVIVGYVLHSRWSFRGHGSRDNVARTSWRFFVVSLVSLGLNAFWTWLLATKLGWEQHTPLIPICVATPLAVFWLQRHWVWE